MDRDPSQSLLDNLRALQELDRKEQRVNTVSRVITHHLQDLEEGQGAQPRDIAQDRLGLTGSDIRIIGGQALVDKLSEE